MRCEPCMGTGLLLVIEIRETGPVPTRYEPCPICQGSGTDYCCGGECAQTEQEPRHD